MTKPRWKPGVPNPGSARAVEKGCTCDRFANNFGAGYWSHLDDATAWWTRPTCPLHGKHVTRPHVRPQLRLIQGGKR